MLTKQEIGKRLEALANERGLSPYEIADRMRTPEHAVRHGLVYDWFKGKHRPVRRNLERICEILGTSLDELLADDTILISRREYRAQVSEEVAVLWLHVLKRIEDGEAPGSAHRAETGQEPTPELIEAMRAAFPAVVSLLSQRAGGDFFALPDADQCLLILALIREYGLPRPPA